MSLSSLPVGTVIAWENATIPDGWHVCDGTNGTLDLRNKFVKGASVDGDVGDTGGVSSHSHTNPNTDERAAHDHGGSITLSIGSAAGSRQAGLGSGASAADPNHSHGGSKSAPLSSEDAHDHSIDDTDATSVVPPNVRRVYIERITV